MPTSAALPGADDGAPLEPSRLTFPVVGLGASAGGLNALLRFFEQMPAASGMAFVVVLHLSPRHASNAAGVLQGATRMAVTQVTGRTRIVADHVYVIPPNKDLAMDDGHLDLKAVVIDFPRDDLRPAPGDQPSAATVRRSSTSS